ncbi:MAG: protein translocase subunit SecD [Acidimicrobiales bacterium]
MRRSGALSLVLIVLLAGGALTGVLVSGWSPSLGLDLQGGASVVYEAGNADEIDDLDDALDTSIEIIRSRVDAIGVAEPEIVRQGDAIVVSLPGVRDQERALEIIGRTAELRFRPVLLNYPGVDPSALPPESTPTTTDTTAPADAPATPTTVATDTSAPPPSEGAVGQGEQAAGPVQDPATTTTAPTDTTDTTDSTAPTDPAATSTTASTTPPGGEPSGDGQPDYCGGTTPSDQDTPEQTVTLPDVADVEPEDGVPDQCFVLGPVPTSPDGSQTLVGGIVSGPEATISQGQWSVTLSIKSDSIDLFNEASSKCFNRDQSCPTGQLAIVLDGRVQSAPAIREPSFNADQGIQISGNFSEREARDLALVLRFGALPVELVPQTVQTVSATLGEDSLNAGVLAGLIGVAVVVLYLLLYYRALGVVVVVGLSVWSSLNFSVISWLGETQGLALSLAGVTGIVISVGVTVDSYVVYFERLKDEIKAGRTIRSSVDRGFTRAFRTILAADISSFIGAALLYWLTVGPVRGFAFFLGLSTLLDVIVAWGFTRPMVALLARSRFFTEARFFGVARGLGAERQRPADLIEPLPAGGGR